jgi:uncharacterized phage protein (TIGR01671 family)
MEEVWDIVLHTDWSYHVNWEYLVNDIAMKNEYWGNKYFLRQFTWLLDKNWKEIYEGDVVELKNGDYEDTRYVINENCSFHFRKIKKCMQIDQPLYCYAVDYLWHFKMIRVEIIWNIYENPELLNS